jgi:hypothetical protein
MMKSRVYLKPGESHPNDILIKRGPNGGMYYETSSHSPKHAYAEIGAAKAISNIDRHVQEISDSIPEGPTKKKAVQELKYTGDKIRNHLTKNKGQPWNKIRGIFSWAGQQFEDTGSLKNRIASDFVGYNRPSTEKRRHLEDCHVTKRNRKFYDLSYGPPTRNKPSPKKHHGDFVSRLKYMAENTTRESDHSFTPTSRIISSRTTREYRTPKTRGTSHKHIPRRGHDWEPVVAAHFKLLREKYPNN